MMNNMTINDETLSAFLDAELGEEEMEAVRQAIANDTLLATRLASLANVDALVRQQAAQIDHSPMPERVLHLLDQKEHKVSSLDTRRRKHFPSAGIPAPVLALAASLVLALGLALNVLLDQGEGVGSAAVYAALETQASGDEISLGGQETLLSRFSFRSQQGDFCRQFQLRAGGSVTENIACRQQGEWQMIASVQTGAATSTTGYQPASAMTFLDETLDSMIKGAVLSREDEQALIERTWH